MSKMCPPSSLDDIKRMRAEGRTKATPADAPEIELDDDFWRNARIVDAAPACNVPPRGVRIAQGRL